MKIVVTGGHFSPAYSVIKKLIKDSKILVIGRKHAFEGDKGITFEYKVCKELSIPFETISAGRLQRHSSWSILKSCFKFPASVVSAVKILKKFSPDACLTFGGYVGLPVAVASKILGIPVILHEQTQKAGLSAKIIAKFASVILISFDASSKYFPPSKTVLTGNPLRPEFFKASKTDFDKPSIYITGGSTGAHFINQLVEKCLPQLDKYKIFHQVGNSSAFNDYERLRKYEDKDYKVSEFFSADDVFTLLRSVDLVISRAGINTVNEIIASKAVSLLIPIPYGQKNEQLDNARMVKDLGYGDYLHQNNASPEVFVRKINDMIRNNKEFKKKLNSVDPEISVKSTDRIVEQVYRYGGNREIGEKKTAD